MFSLDYKVTTSTCDSSGHLKLFSALQMMQDCSELWLRSEPAVQRHFGEQGMAQVLVSRQIEVLRQPAFGEDLRVETSVYDYRALTGLRNTFIIDSQGLPCYRSWSMGAFVDRATGRPRPVAQDVLDTILIEPKRDMVYGARKIALPAVEPFEGKPFCVWRDYIDYNQHVNNAQYIRLAAELLPEGFCVRGMRAEFKTPAHLGDVLVPHVYNEGHRICVVLYVGEAVSVVVEFCA